MRILYWRFLALVRRHPFVIPGHTLSYCWKCRGWGQDAGGYECPACRGQGYQ
jgi:hypothetical protein